MLPEKLLRQPLPRKGYDYRIDQLNAGANYIEIDEGVITDWEIEYLEWMIVLAREVVPLPGAAHL